MRALIFSLLVTVLCFSNACSLGGDRLVSDNNAEKGSDIIAQEPSDCLQSKGAQDNGGR